MSEPMEQNTPKDWGPSWREQPWRKFGYESWEFADPVSWLVYEAAKAGHNSYVMSQHGMGGPTIYRFDGKKLYKILPKIAEKFGWTLSKEKDLDPIKDMEGAILEYEGDDAADAKFYWNRAELRGDWYELRDKHGPDNW